MSFVLSKRVRRKSMQSPMPRSQNAKQVVVVGNGPVGFHLLKSLVKSGESNCFRLTVFGEEPLPAYDRIHLSDFFSGKQQEDLIYEPQEWYVSHGIELIIDDPVVLIDRSKRIVESRSGRAVPYDELVLATGSRPFVPPIEGVDLSGVFVYRTLSDVENIRGYSSNCRHGVVIGGGLLGLEAARALSLEGIDEVEIIETSPFIMPRQLDKSGSQLLRSKIESMGYKVHTNWMADSITDSENRLRINIRNGESLTTDIIVIAAGVRPRDDLARDCRLETASRGGIVVNDKMETSDPHIRACGECASHKGIAYGLVAPGFQMADVIANQLIGHPKKQGITFSYGDLSTELKLLEVNVATLGESLNPRQGFHEITFQNGNIYRKLTLLGSRLVGCMYVGEWDQKHQIREAVNRNKRLWPWQIKRFQAAGNLWSESEQADVETWPASSIVCTCTGTTKGEIADAFNAGAQTTDAVGRQTGAATVCGSCHPLVEQLCGRNSQPATPRQYSLQVASIFTLVGVCSVFVIGPYPVPVSVLGGDWFDAFLQNDFWKQVTGYTLLLATAGSVLFSLRKRLTIFAWGNFLTWRAVHAWIGGSTILGLYWHTGFRMGANLNSALFSVFLSANLIGAITGFVTSSETNFKGKIASSSRTYRPWLTWVHIIGVWPLPVLLVFHILSAYFFD